MQAGGERAGREIDLTVDDARAIAAESSLIAVVSPEIERGGVQRQERVQRRQRSASTASSRSIRRSAPSSWSTAAASRWTDEARVARVALVG